MTQSPHLPEDEPTEAAVMRKLLRGLHLRADEFEEKRSFATAEQYRTEARAMAACMKAAGWSTDLSDEASAQSEEPAEEQTILDAG